MKELSFALASGILTFYLATLLRQGSFVGNSPTLGYLRVACGLMALTIAATSFLRFRVDRDGFSLFVGLAFLFSGIVLFGTVGLFVFAPQEVRAGLIQKTPFTWSFSKSLFALLLVAALIMGKRARVSGRFGREIALILLISFGVAFLLTAGYAQLPASWLVRPYAAVSRPWNLVLMAVLLIPAVGFARRFHATGSSFDAGICLASVVGVASHLAASQSERLMDAPYLLSEGLNTLSYAAALGGTLVENSRLYEVVRLLAVRDPLTNLANYRSLVEVIESELQRSSRTGRQFAVLLADFDGLKTINDRYGHLVGSRALCRVADILRVVCRGTDTPARYGGDEFAMVLPESDGKSASHVIARIQTLLAKDLEFPPMSISVGYGVCPTDGMTPATLLAAADKSLYEKKRGHRLLRTSSRT